MHVGYTVPGVVTGKPISLGGSEGRVEATGRGAVVTIAEAARYLDLDIIGATVAIQGFGNAGATAASLLAEMGATRGGGLRLAAAASTDRAAWTSGLCATGRPSTVRWSASRARGPSATRPSSSWTWTSWRRRRWRTRSLPTTSSACRPRILAEIGNGPTTPDADVVLARNGVFVIPDILCNAGGVTVSYFEWVQDLNRDQWSEEIVNAKLTEIMVRAVRRSPAHGSSVRTSTCAGLVPAGRRSRRLGDRAARSLSLVSSKATMDRLDHEEQFLFKEEVQQLSEALGETSALDNVEDLLDRRHHQPALRLRGLHARALAAGDAGCPRRHHAGGAADGLARGLRPGRRGTGGAGDPRAPACVAGALRIWPSTTRSTSSTTPTASRATTSRRRSPTSMSASVLQGRLTLVRYNNEPQFFIADAHVFYGLMADILDRLGPHTDEDTIDPETLARLKDGPRPHRAQAGDVASAPDCEDGPVRNRRTEAPPCTLTSLRDPARQTSGRSLNLPTGVPAVAPRGSTRRPIFNSWRLATAIDLVFSGNVARSCHSMPATGAGYRVPLHPSGSRSAQWRVGDGLPDTVVHVDCSEIGSGPEYGDGHVGIPRSDRLDGPEAGVVIDHDLVRRFARDQGAR